jgi:hypothetical protein
MIRAARPGEPVRRLCEHLGRHWLGQVMRCRDALRIGLTIGGCRQSERTENVTLGVILPCLSRYVSDKRAGQGNAVVRIDGERSRPTNAMDTISGKILVETHELRRIVNKKALCRVLETGCVGHQMAHEDRFLEALYAKPAHRFLGEMFPSRPLGSIAGSEGTVAQEFEGLALCSSCRSRIVNRRTRAARA